MAQADALTALLEKAGTPLDHCVSILVDEDAVVDRLLKRAEVEGRSDDNEETIRERMRVYREQTEPLVAYYRERGILREVDGMGEVEDVAGRIREALGG